MTPSPSDMGLSVWKGEVKEHPAVAMTAMSERAPARARVVFEGFTRDRLPARRGLAAAVRQDGREEPAHRSSDCVKRHAVIS